ncbi:MAG: hypothetical protein RL591_2642 [Planctomycetota bacterium]
MSTRYLQTLVPSRILPVLVAAICWLAGLGALESFSGSASAQSSRDIVGGPITTQRLERFLAAYVMPTDAEAAAIDRLHEAYLDRYRAEIEPEASTVMASMSGGQPTKDQFEKFLRDLERIQAKLADADNQFLASATELIAEPRRGGMQRVREARERQRLLSGIVRFAPMMLGGGAGFTDLPARAMREEYFGRVSAENRESFDAALRSQEQRTLSQAREYNAQVRKALVGFFDIMTEMQQSMTAAGADPNNLDMTAMEQQQRAMMEKLAALGVDIRKSVKSNFDANRAGAAALAALLPEAVGLGLRLDAADATVNSVGFASDNISRTRMRSLGGRIERDPDISAEAKSEIARILSNWMREQAQANEKLAEVMLDSPGREGMFGMSGESEAVAAARKSAREVGDTALKAISSKLGDKAGTYVSTFTGFEEDGTEREYYRVASTPKLAESDANADATAQADAQRRSAFVDGNAYNTPDALTAADVVRIGRVVGLDSTAQSVVEAIVEGWKTTQWDAQMQAMADRLQDLGSKRISSDESGMIVYDEAATRAFEDLRVQIATLTFELDEKLYADLASALGLASDDALLTLLRLERLDLAVSRAAVGYGGVNAGMPLPLTRTLAAASVDPAVARAVLDGAKAELGAIAKALPERVRERMELTRKTRQVEQVFSTRDQEAVQRASREYGELMLKAQSDDRTFAESIVKAYLDAFQAHAGDAETVSAVRRELLRGAYPDIYKRTETAQPQLDAAARLPSLSEDQRARIAALSAEYEAVYDKLSSEMAQPSGMPMTGAMDETGWAEYQKRVEAVEKARFNRKERTEKVLAELRRVLGAENAALVPGLVKDDATVTADDDDMNPWMGREED